MKLKITVEGKQYEVDVEVEDTQAPVGGHAMPARPIAASRPSAPRSAPAAAPTNGSATSDVADDKAVKSPLMGVVQTIECAPGTDVAADQPLVVLEAMKMLTTITSPAPAKVKAVHVSVGDSVKQGQLLVEFE